MTATPATANETAASLLLDQLKIVSLNSKATTSVANQLAAVLATETGTETSGNLLISGEEYVALVAMFVERLEANMVGTSITTLSHSISNVMTTLNEDQVRFSENSQKLNIDDFYKATSLTEMNTRLASIQSLLEMFTSSLQTQFETLTGGKATENQILSGSIEGTSTDDASRTYLVALQSLMVLRHTIAEVLS